MSSKRVLTYRESAVPGLAEAFREHGFEGASLAVQSKVLTLYSQGTDSMMSKWLTSPFGRVAMGFLAGAGLILLAQGAKAKNVDSDEGRNRVLIQRAFDAWRNGTGGPYDLLTDDATWTITGNSAAAKTYASREAFMSEVIRPFNARMKSRLIPTVPRLYAEGDTVIAFFDAEGTARDGQPYRNTYAWFLEMRDGQIVRANAFFDSIAFDAFWKRVEPASN